MWRPYNKPNPSLRSREADLAANDRQAGATKLTQARPRPTAGQHLGYNQGREALRTAVLRDTGIISKSVPSALAFRNVVWLLLYAEPVFAASVERVKLRKNAANPAEPGLYD
ncbi:hypothetical protein G3M48_000604, partial [Beauveria asiatica]